MPIIDRSEIILEAERIINNYLNYSQNNFIRTILLSINDQIDS